MTELEALRDRLKEHLAAHQALLDGHKALLDAVEAELARVPTLADVKALVARVSA